MPLPALWAFLTFAAAFIPTVGHPHRPGAADDALALLEGRRRDGPALVVGWLRAHQRRPGLPAAAADDGHGAQPEPPSWSSCPGSIVWAWIPGASGALLAVPLTPVGLVAILDASPSTRGIAALMRNRVDAPPGLIDAPEEEAATARAVTDAGPAPGRTDEDG